MIYVLVGIVTSLVSFPCQNLATPLAFLFEDFWVITFAVLAMTVLALRRRSICKAHKKSISTLGKYLRQ